ncbi:MAG: thiamine-phosphate kinase [Bacteroidales bacterium]|jgi:thiamine-monophosphate kinase|nr:thiamine-phosphate kinase [Bacteroidales bacterium]
MDINKIGEFGLISRLTADIKPVQPATLKGIGDDAAILRYGDTALAVTTDTLVEGVNFDLTYAPLQHLGYKAAIAGFSDLYAMNAAPRQLLVSIAVSAKFSVEALELLYRGLKLACKHHRVDLVGGDTAPSVTGLMITVTAIGEVDPAKATYRNKAQKGDLICVSGNLGAAYMGLQVLEREKKLFEEDPAIQPQLDNYGYVVRRQLKPEARRDIVDFFASSGLLPTAMIDISDGLSSELLHICTASNVGCEIHHHKIPIADETVAAAEELFLEPLIVALNGGDDYELLFTIPVADYDKVVGNEDVSIIGYVTGREEGCNLVTETGTRIEIKAQGW